MNIVRLIIAVGGSLLAGLIGSFATSPSIPTWYASLNKPSFNPPNWLFGPAWTLLYVLMGTAAYLIWQKGWEKREVKLASSLFIAQLLLNSLWSILFFGLKSPFLALIEIVVLWFAILLTIISFFRLSPAAGWLMVPYIIWVSFASILNYFILILNK